MKLTSRRLAVLGIAVCTVAACSSTTAEPTTPTKASTPTASTSGSTSAQRLPYLSAIQLLTPLVGYVAWMSPGGARLGQSKDGGLTWESRNVQLADVTSIRFVNQQVGWVSGFVVDNNAACPGPGCRGLLLRTVDGGSTWRQVLSVATDPMEPPVPQLQAVDGENAWVVTSSVPCANAGCVNDLEKTTDGGRTWVTGLSGHILSIRFASLARGWASLETSAGTEVRMTNDGGTTWRTVLRTSGAFVANLDAATTERAWLLTADGGYCTSSDCSKYELFGTKDGGLTWLSQGNPKTPANRCSGGMLQGPLFASAARGWMPLSLGAGGANVGPGGLLRSEDGGITWMCSTTPPNVNLISAADSEHLWVSSEDRQTQTATVYSSADAGRSWHVLDLSRLTA